MTAVALPPQTADLPIPEQRRNPEAPWPGQTKEAARLMRRLWVDDPDTAEELVEGLYAMSRTQLGRVIDNLMWTLSNQPRQINDEQMAYIRALWGRKMTKPMDARLLAKVRGMTEVDAQRFVYRLQAEPDLPR